MEVLGETGNVPLVEDLPAARSPARVVLVGSDLRTSLLIGEMLRQEWAECLVLCHAERLTDASHELLDRGASCVLLELPVHGTDHRVSVEQIRTAAPDVPIVVAAVRPDQVSA